MVKVVPKPARSRAFRVLRGSDRGSPAVYQLKESEGMRPGLFDGGDMISGGDYLGRWEGWLTESSREEDVVGRT